MTYPFGAVVRNFTRLLVLCNLSGFNYLQTRLVYLFLGYSGWLHLTEQLRKIPEYPGQPNKHLLSQDVHLQ